MSQEKSNLKEIFYTAQKIDVAGERDAFLERACAGDVDLRRRVDALLAAADRDTDFLSAPAIALPDAETQQFTPPPESDSVLKGGLESLTEGPGTVIGPYKLLQQIGEGGFGAVYMAEQTQPVKRRVALKVIKAGMDTKAVIARFEAERQALAMMDHPHIARVLDAGATESGRPYFVMELVKGIPITEFCDEAGYDTRRRLKLFMDVCNAVQHAHHKGIIHRDLKPSNVLVTLRDDQPMVKIIDFGIAKATEQKLTEKTLFTAFGQMVGTPVYMSPEQAVMSELDVDTRSDVYSLGVLLYELLTGSTPIDPEDLRRAGYDEIRRRIREETPSKPSTKLSTLAPEIKLAVAARRHANPKVLVKECDGDLDWIVLKALEKERTRRYESASAFAQDIARHLRSEPVTAVAPSTAYRVRKFVARNRGAVVAGSAVLLALIAGTVVSSWLALEAREAESNMETALGEKEDALKVASEERERAVENARSARESERRAEARLRQVEESNEVLASIFDDLDPEEVARHEKPLQELVAEQLDRAIEAIEGDTIGDALTVARIQTKLGHALRVLGEAKRSIPVLRKALATFEEHPGAETADLSAALLELAMAHDQVGEPVRGLSLKERSLALVEKEHSPDDEATLEGKLHIAESYHHLGRSEEALALRKEVFELRARTLGPEHVDSLRTESKLASSYWSIGQHDRAISHQEHVCASYEIDPGLKDPRTWEARYQLSLFYARSRRPEKALKILEDVNEFTVGTYGEYHPTTLDRASFLAKVRAAMARGRQDAGQLRSAIELAEQTVQRLESSLSEDHPLTLKAREELTTVYRIAEMKEDAVREAKKNYGLAKTRLGEAHPETLTYMTSLAVLLGEAKRRGEAIPLLEKTERLKSDKLGPEHPSTVSAKFNLAWGYLKLGRAREAIPILERVVETRERLSAGYTPTVTDCVNSLGRAYEKTGRYKEALKQFEKRLALERAKDPPDTGAVYEALHTVASICERLGGFANLERSTQIHEEMLKILKETRDDPRDRAITSCRECLARLYSETSQWEKACSVLETLLAGEEDGLGKDSPQVLQRREQLAFAYTEAGQLDKALALRLESLKQERKGHVPEGSSLHGRLALICMLQLQLGKWADAEASGRECIALREMSMPDHWLTFNARSMLGRALLGQGKYTEAEPLLVSGYEGMWENRTSISKRGRSRIPETLERLVNLYEKRGADGDAAKAEHYRRLLDELRASDGSEETRLVR